jgi:hypothetical protein
MTIPDLTSIDIVLREALRLNIIKIIDIPSIPNELDKPILAPIILEINNGGNSDRVKKYTITTSAKKKINELFELDGRRTFIKLPSKSLANDFTYTYCRSTKIWIEDGFASQINESENIYLYADFDSFDLKIGTDLKNKMVILKQEEMELVEAEHSKILKWNIKISKLNNFVSRLKYYISEFEGAKC